MSSPSRPLAVFRVKVTGRNPGPNACTVAIAANGASTAVVSEAGFRTAPQAEVEGVAEALRSLSCPHDVEVRTCSRCLVARINGRIDSGIALACMDGGHSIRAVYVPKDAGGGRRSATEAQRQDAKAVQRSRHG